MNIESLILQEEDGTFVMDIKFKIPLTEDKKTKDMLWEIEPILTPLGYQITDMSKHGELDYKISMLKNRKGKIYKLCRKIISEAEKITETIVGNMDIKEEKNKLKTLQTHDLVDTIKNLESELDKDSFSSDDIKNSKKLSIFKEELAKRKISLEKVFRENNFHDKSIDMLIFLVENIRHI